MHHQDEDGSGAGEQAARGPSRPSGAGVRRVAAPGCRRRLSALPALLVSVVAAGVLATAAAAATTAGPPVNRSLPVIRGTARDGSSLGSSVGSWHGAATITFAHQWLLCDASGEDCTPIAEGNARSYKLGHEDVGHTLRSMITATNSEGTASVISLPSHVIAVLAPKRGRGPVISAIPQDGQPLAVTINPFSGTPPLAYTYQWKVCVKLACSAIAGATGATYHPTTSEIGQQLRVVVTATNSAGGASSTSGPSRKVVPGPPVSTAAPVVSGTPVDGQTLSASTGTWAGTPPFIFSYQWKSCSMLTAECSDIDGATAATYTVGPLDVASSLEVEVTATGAHGATSATSDPTSLINALLPSNTSLPSITGSLIDGSTLTAITGSWSGTAPLNYSYQWELCNTTGEACKEINNTSSLLTLADSDVGSTLRVIVTATNTAGSTSATSDPTSLINALLPSNTSLPSITGSLIDGSTLTAITGSWSGTAPLNYSYQWELCNTTGEACKEINNTSSLLTLADSDVGSTLRVIVTATNTAGSTSATSDPTSLINALLPSNTSLPSITGSLIDGSTLTAITGSWSGTAPLNYSYQWELCNTTGEACKEINNTSSLLTLADSDVGSTLRVIVTATNTAGSTSATSDPTSLINALLPSNTSLPSITGSLIDGSTLTAITGSWSGTAPLNYSYQWELCNTTGEACKEINNTSSLLTLADSDVGSTLRVIVTATNTAGSTSATSDPTSLINALLPSNTSLPSITGSLIDGSTLTAITGSWSGTAPLNYSYQWELCNVLGSGCTEIAKATGPTYVLGLLDVGLPLRVTVTATNAAGSTPASSHVTGLIKALGL